MRQRGNNVGIETAFRTSRWPLQRGRWSHEVGAERQHVSNRDRDDDAIVAELR